MITFKSITTIEEAEVLRCLRNECAEWMTQDTSQISETQQRVFFWEKLATGLIEGFIMCDGAAPVAYGLLIWDGKVFGRAWSSTGVKKSARGKGYGRLVTIENVRRAHEHNVPMWAEVRQDNAGQQKICRSIGYYVIDTFRRDGLDIDLMRCDKLKTK